jgi:hypothetical protein
MHLLSAAGYINEPRRHQLRYSGYCVCSGGSRVFSCAVLGGRVCRARVRCSECLMMLSVHVER